MKKSENRDRAKRKAKRAAKRAERRSDVVAHDNRKKANEDKRSGSVRRDLARLRRRKVGVS